jgi:hypothetical protein
MNDNVFTVEKLNEAISKVEKLFPEFNCKELDKMVDNGINITNIKLFANIYDLCEEFTVKTKHGYLKTISLPYMPRGWWFLSNTGSYWDYPVFNDCDIEIKELK